ncbi:MAG: PadR family transcriptional regulator [Actinomycetia bacterium]|nr:PadR family transcriptional regulator [Actinomycetes bacterium]
MKHVLLGLLAKGDAHGYELKRRHDELFAVSASSINVGQIYVTLSRLEKDSLVDHRSEQSDEGGPDRKVYSLTELGEKELRGWLESSGPVPQVRSAALLKIVVAFELGDHELRSLVAAHRRRCLAALRDLDRRAVEVGPSIDASGLIVQAAALHLQAELRWLDLLTEQIDHSAPGSSVARIERERS